MKTITSFQNPLIKQIGLLGAKAKTRREEGLFLVEGLREAGLALEAGYKPVQLLFDPDCTSAQQVSALCRRSRTEAPEPVAVASAVFEKIAYRSGVPNVLVLFEMRETALNEITLPEKPLILVLEGIEKPGNLGAILRTSDAAGVNAVFVCDPATDLYNPNTIRASLGALFTLPVLVGSSEEAWNWLKTRKIPVYATWLEAGKSLFSCDLSGAIALVMGSEATGISPFWVEKAEERIIIPMMGQVDSMNVSASTAIILFEAVRQRLGSF